MSATEENPKPSSQNPQELLAAGSQALKQQNYLEAIEYLEAYYQVCPDETQAQMWLVQAYRGDRQLDKAENLCRELMASEDLMVQDWAKKCLASLKKRQKQDSEPKNMPQSAPKATRIAQTGVKLAMKGVASSLSLASGVTISLLFGMVLALCLGLLLILNSNNPTLGLLIAVTVTVIFNGVVFFVSPLIMDCLQSWLYGTRWIALSEVQNYSPEAAEVIERVCRQKKLREPRLGIIDDQNPTAFTYGSLPDTARLVVSRGLFTYLDDDEIATVYAHELGHIVHWDFALMTMASTLVQIMYLLYVFARNLGKNQSDNKIGDAAKAAAIAAYLFYLVGTYLILYLSRTREYYADHFAAETTGNPNGLARALVKIAYGLLEEGDRQAEPSRLTEGTRALGIYDPKAAMTTGTAYRITSDSSQIGRVFLWDMFNPWGWLMELNSTHPLTGKRIRALTTYAEQMGLATEFDLAAVVREGKRLNKRKLYKNFALDIVIFHAEWLGLLIGIVLGASFASLSETIVALFSFPLFGFGLGTFVKLLVMYPDFGRSPESDILSLLSNPYASPLRGRPVKLHGELIGRGDAGYRFGSDLKFQDPTGMIYLHYASRFGALGNFLFGATQVKSLIGTEVTTIGWFRRGIVPWLDLVKIESPQGTVKSYHRFWLLVLSVGSIVLGFMLPLWL